jgi:hypothetical protein
LAKALTGGPGRCALKVTFNHLKGGRIEDAFEHRYEVGGRATV